MTTKVKSYTIDIDNAEYIKTLSETLKKENQKMSESRIVNNLITWLKNNQKIINKIKD